MTNRYAWQDSGGIRVATVGRSAASREVLLFMGMLAYVGDTEIQRCELLAAEWDARVTIADMPGCGYGPSRLTAVDRSELRRGYFTSVARRMARSAQEVNPRLLRRKVNVVGYSLGASLAAAAAADPGLLRVGELTLVEPIAVRQWNPFLLLRSVYFEDRAADTAREDFADRQTNPSRADLALLGYALSRGQLPTDLLHARDLHGHVSAHLVRGGDSGLCTREAVDRAVKFLRSKGLQVEHMVVPGQHNLWHNRSDISLLARQVASRWPDTPHLVQA